MTDDIRIKLVHGLTSYDRKQTTKKYYNRYALGQYFAKFEDISERMENGMTLREALRSCYGEGVLKAALKAVGESPATKEELRGDYWRS